MRGKYRPHHILEVVLLFIALAGFSASNSKANENSKYLNAVREFADNVLKYGRDTYGPKHTPLFVDGLNIHTHEPVKWIAPNGDRWILSSLSSQQNLFRTLDGLSKITGDSRYRQAAMEAIEYAFANLRSPTGLFYWGRVSAYDAQADKICGGTVHSFKFYYPYYELMWDVNPKNTEEFIEAFWATHIMDWSNLEMNRYGPLNGLQVAKGWDNEYKGGPVFFESRGRSFIGAGSDLFYAGAMLSKLLCKKQPLVWSKRLSHRYVDTRDPNIGISGYVYTRGEATTLYPFNDDYSGHSVLLGTLFPMHPGVGNPKIRQWYLGELTVSPGIVGDVFINPYICEFLLGEMLGSEGKEFMQWALEELTAWGKVAYRKKDNSFIPMLTDGTSLEGYVCKKDSSFGPKGTVFMPIPAVASDFWAYALAYRMTGDSFMWEIARDIAQGNDWGDIGTGTESRTHLESRTDCSNPYALLGFLELHKRTRKTAFLDMAQRIGDNILANHFYRGFFVPSRRHVYTKFNAIDTLVLLHLDVVLNAKPSQVPWVWPSRPTFKAPYRMRQEEIDSTVFYRLTDLREPPKSLQEAAAAGEIDEVKLLISKGADINGWDYSPVSPLYCAAKSGHEDIIELLLAEGADVNAKGDWRFETSLHYAARGGYKNIAELFIEKGADFNAKNSEGQTPLDVAVSRNRKNIAELLIANGADVSLHTAAYIGDLQRVERFIDNRANVDAKDQKGQTALHYAAKAGQMGMVRFLIAKGADVSAKDNHSLTPLYEAVRGGHKDVVALLIDNGANVNARAQYDYTPMYYAAWSGSTEMVEFLVEKGADINVKDEWDWTPLHYMAQHNYYRDMAEFLIAKGADVNAEDKWGQTPLQVAKEKGHTRIVELLRKHGAKEDKSPQTASKE